MCYMYLPTCLLLPTYTATWAVDLHEVNQYLYIPVYTQPPSVLYSTVTIPFCICISIIAATTPSAFPKQHLYRYKSHRNIPASWRPTIQTACTNTPAH
ncbi:hypothetical protein F4678DRAFT_402059 [Xylaria arbuscula]|nr:hypothetical protein F4678DRAFT_402059 [Xylaria arbuscula]